MINSGQKEMQERFSVKLAALENMAGGPVHLIKTIGLRRSFVAGQVPDDLSAVQRTEVLLEGEWSLFCYAGTGKKIDPERMRSVFYDE